MNIHYVLNVKVTEPGIEMPEQVKALAQEVLASGGSVTTARYISLEEFATSIELRGPYASVQPVLARLAELESTP